MSEEGYERHVQACAQCQLHPPFRLCARGCELLRNALRAEIPEQFAALEDALELLDVVACEQTGRLVAKAAIAAALAVSLGRGVPTWVFLSEMGIISGLLFGHYYRRAGGSNGEAFRTDLEAWMKTMAAIADRVRAADGDPAVH